MKNKTITFAILIPVLTSCSAEVVSTPVVSTVSAEATLPAPIENTSPPNIILVIADDDGIKLSSMLRSQRGETKHAKPQSLM